MIKNIDGFVPFEVYKKLKKERNLTFRNIEKLVFKNGFTPLRYKRNQNSICQKEQYRLFKSHICIVGCGALGSTLAELLARIGVGKLTLIDKDRYVEHNLNRQKFSTLKNLGKLKAKVVSTKLKQINKAVKIKAKIDFLDEKNIKKLTSKCDVIVDCVDDVKTKILLSKYCEKNKLNFVHGSIAGWCMQVGTPKSLNKFYKNERKGAEEIVGNLVFTATTCASLQACICINILLNKNFSMENVLFADLKDMEFIHIPRD